jgi:hypothetical protein
VSQHTLTSDAMVHPVLVPIASTQATTEIKTCLAPTQTTSECAHCRDRRDAAPEINRSEFSVKADATAALLGRQTTFWRTRSSVRWPTN